MQNLVLYCKSYHRDVLRARRLMQSVQQFNHDKIACYLSCPAADLPLFKNTLDTSNITLLADEEIIAQNPKIQLDQLNQLAGGLSQQIVKSEFWRLGISENYLCMDSDSYFIRPFHRHDMLTPTGMPYTVMNESQELMLFALRHRYQKIPQNTLRERAEIMKIFARTGRGYDFGPLPVVWNRRVWSDLAEQFLAPRGQSFLDAIVQFPSEMRWYGEALLQYHSVELWPVETLFRCYHYEQQYIDAKKAGENTQALAAHYLGVCVQSNWDSSIDYGAARKSAVSRFNRYIKRRVLKRLV